jgi:hypothetical protein
MSMLNKLQALLLGLGLTSAACASAADVQVSVAQEIVIRIGERGRSASGATFGASDGYSRGVEGICTP